VNFDPMKSVTLTVPLMVDSPELVKSALCVVLLGEDEPVDEDEPLDEEPVSLAVDEASVVPVPVSLCARTPSAARHSVHTGRDNMIAAALNQLSLDREIAGGEEQVQRGTGKAQTRESVCGRFVEQDNNGSDLQHQQAICSGGPVMMGRCWILPTESGGTSQTLAVFSQGPC
jgi:hypothetical protein